MIGASHPKDFNQHPMLLLAACFAFGIVCSHAGAVATGGAVAFAAVLFIACAIKSRSALVVLPLLFIPLGTICHQVEKGSVGEDRIKRLYAENAIESFAPVEIEGVLQGFPEPAHDGAFLTVRAEKIVVHEQVRTASGRVRLFVIGYEGPDKRLDLRHGSIVRVACRPERDERYLNPGVASRPEMLDQQGIDAVATVKSPLLVEKLGEDAVFLPLAWAYELRRDLVSTFRRNFSARSAGVMTASLLGDRHFLDRETAEVFRRGGTFHVLVISGLHITFIGGLTLWLVSWFTKRVIWQSLIAGGFLWAYTFAVGAEIPVVRASLMFSFVLIGRLIYRQNSLLNALGTCTLILLVWRPGDLFSASFQLTVVSVAAIVGCAFPLIEKLRAIGSWTPSRITPLPPRISIRVKRFCEFLYWNEAEWRIESRRYVWSAGLFKSPYLGWFGSPGLKAITAYVFEGLVVSIVVQVWMLPLLVVYFHRFSPVAPVLNLWVGVLLALESFAAVGAVLVASVSEWLATPLFQLTEVLNDLMMSLPRAVSALDLADLRVPVYAGQAKVLYGLYAGAVVVMALRVFRWDPFSLKGDTAGRHTLITSGLALMLGVVIIFHPFSSPGGDGRLRIDFLDVGQGDAALITFPGGQTMLVDGGGRPDYSGDTREFEPDVPRIGESVVSEFLWEKGYSRVDYVVGTHPDADHIQGLIDVIQNFEVGTLILGGIDDTSPTSTALLAVAGEKHVHLATVLRTDVLTVDGVTIRVLNPVADMLPDAGATNDASVVLHLAFGRRSFLLTGDIEREAESDLLRTVSLAADVVKVPHHGSRTSSTEGFVEATGATVAVISVGRRSRFGHPHRQVVDRWRDSGAAVMATGERGTITIETDGENLDVRTFLP